MDPLAVKAWLATADGSATGTVEISDGSMTLPAGNERVATT